MVYSACSPAMVLDWSAGRWEFRIIEKRNAHKAAVRHGDKAGIPSSRVFPFLMNRGSVSGSIPARRGATAT